MQAISARSALPPDNPIALKTIGFVGGGNLARALIAGLTKEGFPPRQIVVSNRTSEKLENLVREFGIIPAETNRDTAARADILVLAVKPQDTKAVIEEIKEAVQAKAPLIISLAAGLRMQELEEWLGEGLSMIRTMPNTAAIIGKGITALFANDRSTEEQRALAASFFNSVGTTCWVKEERDLDVLTPFMGSGIAYLYLFIEAMEAAAKETGVEPDLIKVLARQTVFSAAEMALAGESLDVLTAQVATRGGVTEPSLDIVRKGGLFESLLKAFRMVTERCERLSEELQKASHEQPESEQKPPKLE